MRNQSEVPNFVVTQTLKRLTLPYIAYVIAVILGSFYVGGHLGTINTYLHICITLFYFLLV